MYKRQGTVIINLCDAGGYRQFSNSKHPIKAPADLKGLKMRTNGMKTIDTVSYTHLDVYKRQV